jgi:hypothetical protein
MSALELAAPAPSLPPGADRTLRSRLGPEASGEHVEPQGYAVHVVEPVHATPRSGGARSGGRSPSTQLSGVAVPEPAPGESVPVLAAPPPPPRRISLNGTEVRVWPLVLVGVVFAAIGVGITLAVMLGDAPADEPSHPQHGGPPHAAQPGQHPAPPPHHK